ncbi:hypothetical protein FSP39_017759 [Pinctada imbricata]|uniref:MRG domain-containing protein n=1 Tax=Pinctada imbricata TaxID=66713 RepID=A0AA89BXK7_PINIB|nr:hypothetical protein FSP39_017759 [Pinctada imbricata]
MSTRGIKFNFSVGEYVLCFEPDPTKARVLYNAKILDSTVSRDPHGAKVAAYHVHFQGWNQSWDRIVPENFILKNTEENRDLMKKLADTTKKYRINKRRNKRIDRILRKAFKGRPPLYDYDSDDGDPYDDEDDDDDDEGGSTDEEIEFRDGIADGTYSGDEGTDTDQNGILTEEESESVNGSESSGGSRGEDKKKKINIELDIPQRLKDQLEKDYVAVNKDNMLVKLPPDDNVVMILEGFVKSFCVNLLCGSPIKSSKEGPHIPLERNIPLCKELVDGLRICFDYTLPLILLYEPETEQLEKLTQIFKSKAPQNKSNNAPSPVKPPAKGRSLSRQNSHSKSNGESSPKIPKLSPKIFRDKVDFDSPVKSEEISGRRMTRRSLHEQESSRKTQERPKSPIIDILSASDDNEEKKSEPTRRASRKRNCKVSETSGIDSCKSDAVVTLTKIEGNSEVISNSKPRKERPPPLLIPSNMVSEGSSNDSKASSVDGDPVSMTYQEDVVDRILAWQLLPADSSLITPNAPSMMYGAQHLLRLFIKLPDLISNMDMGTCKIKVLLSLLQHFLDYLMERHDELFQESHYVSIDEAVLGT